MAVVAMRTVDMALVIVLVMIVIAIGTVHVIFLIHLYCYSGIKLPGIISPLLEMCTLLPSIRPVFNSPSNR